MYLYRISKLKHTDDLSCEGAKKTGGRWDKKGTAVIQTSDSIALATLETLVHSPLNLIPKNIAVTVFELPNFLKIGPLEIAVLPHNWTSYPAPAILKKTAKSLKTPVLRAPSAVIPVGECRNYILNPIHLHFGKVRIIEI